MLTAALFGAVIVAAVVMWQVGDGEPGRDGAPSWSPDGRQIVFAVETGTKPSELYVMDQDGGGRRVIETSDANDTNPAWSPDGRRIAFESDRDGNTEIYVMDLQGRSVRRLTTNPGHDGAPAWSPDGSRITFMSERNQRAGTDIYSMSAADGSGLLQHTDDLTNWAPQYSPDGRFLAMQVTRDIVVLDLTSGHKRRLTYEPNNGMNPTWSPDGRRMAFVSTRNGRAEIFTMSADGTEQTRLVSMATGGVIDPRWSPDGLQIAFVLIPETPVGGEPLDTQAIYTIELSSGRLTRLSE
jgi:Tol biopolymer transport system component